MSAHAASAATASASTASEGPSAPSDETLVGEVAALVYSDPSSGFGVVELVPEGGEDGEDGRTDPSGDRAPRAVGPLAGLTEGQPVRLVGRWTTHERYGPTFEAAYYELETPRSLEGLIAFLSSDRFPGIGDVLAHRIVDAFGLELPEVLRDRPADLARLTGVSDDLARRTAEAWQAAGALAELVQRLGAAGASSAIARAAHRILGDEALTTLSRDPYELLRVPGARWAHAEALAREQGLASDDPRRLRAAAAAAHAALRDRDGHVALPTSVLRDETARLLATDAGGARAALEQARADARLTVEDESRIVADPDDPVRWYLPAALRSERGLARDLRRLAGARSRVADATARTSVDAEHRLAGEQAAAVRAALTRPVTVLTGGPGTGKTRTVVEVVAACEASDLRVALCAPTGRAAKHLEEVTGRPASTVHRLLEAQPSGGGTFRFGFGRDRRLPHDLVVADEVSMADLGLCAALAAAVEDGAHLLLVGDADQLPPVGPGAVLRDLLAVARDATDEDALVAPADEDARAAPGGEDALVAPADEAGGQRAGEGRAEFSGDAVVPVVASRLQTVHRQAAASRIVTLAHEVNAGEAPTPAGRDADVFAVVERRDAIAGRVAAIVAERAPAFFDCAPSDVQVLAPMYRGPAGVDALNQALRERLNPPRGRPAVAGFREGDRVVQTRNDPELGVANGDVGEVAALDPKQRTLEVAFPQGTVDYAADDAADLRPAWCLTVHKAQGGEWPVVVLVLDRGHHVMLARELAYTAITRAREGLLLVGDPSLLPRAARRRGAGLAERMTLLAERLRTPTAEAPPADTAEEP
ncbi:hypothetical protein ER308_18640 [Egibacter rhizosphaerae]|uniref:ATP-dependent RecD2 DNA helicase n=1 Tax=Egibacter rhizosphaerae TaxID=1670831 RepID=A0A411YJA2_9ACTN|nr:AAA family ATPase [Egibacter rhizosphaerae]QBI21385.1 hypothetical protein ER308_18640 [Egibacter rhizosphaerae]